MGLYLCIFKGEQELDGVEVGSYDDFSKFREAVSQNLEGGVIGSRFPTLMLHSDCDGSWSADECAVLEQELTAIATELKDFPPMTWSGWQLDVARSLELRATSLAESFIDVDGEFLLDRLLSLCQLAREKKLPILFQ